MASSAYQMSTTKSSRSPTIQESDTPYTRLIRSCAFGFPGSKAYYDQLVDYIKQASPSLQDPSTHWRCYRVGPPDGSTSSMTADLAITTCDVKSVAPTTEACSSRVILETPVVLQSPSYIVAVDGFLSPSAVEALGTKFKIRPEMFISHLDFAARHSHETFAFATSNLPSSRISTIQIRMTSIGSAQASVPMPENLEAVSSTAKGLCRTWKTELLVKKEDGHSIIRDMHVHDDRMFSIEHFVSINFSRNLAGTWNGEHIFLLCVRCRN
jgi:hypothetical protein